MTAAATTTTSTTSTSPESMVEQIEESTEATFDFVTHIVDILVIVTFLGTCFAAIAMREKLRENFCPSLEIDTAKLCRWRDFLQFVMAATCNCCGLSQALGYDTFTMPSRVLVLRLVGVYGLPKGMEVYVETSTQPLNPKGHQNEVVKCSRIHKCQDGHVDLMA